MDQLTMRKGVTIQLLLRGLVAPLFMIALLLVSAGRWDYWQAYLYMLVNMALLLVNLWALRDNPDLIAERLSPGEGMKGWDRIYFTVTTLLYFTSLVIAGLDVGRFGWTNPLPWWVYALAILGYLLGQAIFIWAKRANRFFSSVVRIQTDRGQIVCQDGPYQYVRHPGYAGGMIYMLAGALMLGSVWALVPQALASALLVVRTTLEDRTLHQELPGYAAYASKVKYKLLPGVW